MTRNKVDKAKAQRIHAKKRAKERYNLDINKELYRSFIDRVHDGRRIEVFRQSRRLVCYKIWHDEKDIYFIFDQNRNTIVTFLTEEMVRLTRDQNHPIKEA
jgi:hypothetical protein